MGEFRIFQQHLKTVFQLRVWLKMHENQSEESMGFASTISQIEAQEKDLVHYATYLESRDVENLEPEEASFCGAGDSYACAKFVERLMNFKPRAFDPYDVLLYPEVLRGKRLFFISVSGRTRANILAAMLAKRRGAKKTVAITGNPESELAKSCSDIIELKFTKSIARTPGTNSFTASLLACGILFKNVPKFDAGKIIKQAREWSEEIEDSPDASYHFVGSGAFYGIAIYGAAKIFEFAGGRADYQMTEEFSHLNLFSVEKGKEDIVIILRFGESDEKANSLAALLTSRGTKNYLAPIQFEKEHVLSRALSYSISMQYLALNVAKARGLERPAFLSDPERLEISNKMIY